MKILPLAKIAAAKKRLIERPKETTMKVDVPKCQYFGCTRPAEYRIERASTNVCEEHLLLNTLRFGCVFEATKLPTPRRDGG